MFRKDIVPVVLTLCVRTLPILWVCSTTTRSGWSTLWTLIFFCKDEALWFTQASLGHCQSPGRLNPPGSPSVGRVASDPISVGKDVTPSCDVIGKYGNGKPYCNSCAATTAFGTAEVVAGVAVSPRIEVGTAVPVETPPCDLEKAALERGLGVHIWGNATCWQRPCCANSRNCCWDTANHLNLQSTCQPTMV